MRLFLMKSKAPAIATRHPNIVLVYEDEVELTGTIEIIAEYLKGYRSIPLNDQTTKFLSFNKPQVILFALSSVDKNVAYYSRLLEEEKLPYTHQAILMCTNKESGIAFRCCMKGLFDNYFVFQPLYEKYRLLMLIQNGLNFCRSNSLIVDYYDDKIEKLDDGLEKIIEETGRFKQELTNKMDASRQQLSDLSGGDAEFAGIDPDQLLAMIRDNHIKPLLNVLEGDIKQTIDSMLGQLVTQQHNAKAATMNSEKVNTKPPIQTVGKKGLLAEIAQAKAASSSAVSILVVEDNAIYREMLTSVLEKENYVVSEAEDGALALELIQKESFDLIIMDLYMPKLDGLNTTKRIRLLSGGKKLPIIALTGNKNKDNVKKWLNYGLNGYIVKPSSKKTILDAVNKALATTPGDIATEE